MGIVTTSSETAFTQSPEEVYDFVTKPANWTKTYPGGPRISGLPDRRGNLDGCCLGFRIGGWRGGRLRPGRRGLRGRGRHRGGDGRGDGYIGY